MLHRETKPTDAIANHVECYWQVEKSSADDRQALLLIPEATLDIVFCDQGLTVDFGNDDAGAISSLPPGGWIIGQKTQCYRLTLPANASVFGIRIKPFAISCFTPVSPKEFRNSYLPFCVASLSRHAECIEQLCTAGAFEQRVLKAELLIKGILANAPQFSPLVRAQTNYVLDRRGNLRFAELQTHFEISRPTLCSKFLDHMGLLPKELGKIWRLNHFMMLQARYPNVSHTELSLRAGYFDQSHLINEFGGLFNYSPAKYFKQEATAFSWYPQSIERRFSDKYPAVG